VGLKRYTDTRIRQEVAMAEQYQLFVLECQGILEKNPYFLGSRGFARWLRKNYPELLDTEGLNNLRHLVLDVNEVEKATLYNMQREEERRLARTS